MKIMKNLMKKISVLALVAVIFASNTNDSELVICCSDVDPNPFIEVRSVPNPAEIFES